MYSGYWYSFNKEDTIVAGANPKLIKSAKESRSLPIIEKAFNLRAAKPSKKSKIADAKINKADASRLPWKAKATAMHPENRFKQVIVLGMWFLMFMV